jgi:hypothetical protein
MIDVLGIKNADKLVPTTEDQKPRDPVSENMAVLVGKPVKAFIYQDQDAHIATHQSFMQDPMIAQTIGQNPMAQQLMASLQAHIAEHLAFKYRKQIEERLGAPLPMPDEELPEEIEIQLARLVADAGKQLTQIHQQEAAQQQAQQQQQDPLFQLQQAEVQIKQADIQRKSQKDQADIALAQEKLELEKVKVAVEAEKENTRVSSQQTQAEQRAKMDLLKTVLAEQGKPRTGG